MSLPRRYHALDAVRAAMMFLGVGLHAALSYLNAPFDEWDFKDAHTSRLFDLLVVYVHSFRMPVFFVIAGFFGALVLERSGPAGFVRHRFLRIGLPLLIASPIVFLMTRMGNTFAHEVGNPNRLHDALACGFLTSPGLTYNLDHLWFLYDLLILSLATAAVAILVERLGLARPLGRVAALLARRRVGLLAGVVATVACLARTDSGLLETSAELIPRPILLVTYAVFYVFGFALYRERDVLERWPAGSRWMIALTIPLWFALLVGLTLEMLIPPRSPQVAHGIVVAASALLPWVALRGVVGVALRWFVQHSPIVRYLSDASYFVYIVHFPLVIWFAGLFAPVDLPALVKFSLVTAATTLTAVLLYDGFVRSTVIGRVLNGAKHPRAIFAGGVDSVFRPRAG